MAEITRKSSEAAFPLWPLEKRNSLLKGSESNVKDIVRISIIAFWRFHLGSIT